MSAQPTHTKPGGGRAFFAATGVFAAGFLAFYLFQFRAHKKDNQTCELSECVQTELTAILPTTGIVRHGQQPGNDGAPKADGQRYVANWKEREVKTGSFPLPGNDDHRGSEGLLASVMSFVAGKGLNPDPRVPEEILNKTQPTPQRVNAAGTHHYTKRLP
ncbi:hypothetical protein BC835DRAFT_241001 [Cytidiella melzeri]|nr:hypothetical protein BC835DRAFT_241001 [Cytidiella melzeri]